MMDDNFVPAQFVACRDNGPDIVFNGCLLGSIDNKDQAESTGRWLELSVYRTDGGKLICERLRRTLNPGERDVCEAAVCDSTIEMTDFFGFGRLSKLLFSRAKIETSVFVP